LIDKAEIERVKRSHDLAAFARSRGIALKKRGKQLVGLCPFHDDHEPSFIVDPTKQLWNCLGACNAGGDIYRFVMKADAVDFREAHKRLGGEAAEPPAPTSNEELDWLERATAHYHRRLLETPTAQDYLRSRGITAVEFAQTFRIGYSDGTLSEKLPAAGKQALRRVGVLTGSGKEALRGCVVFPLVAAETNQVVSLYGRSLEGRQHLYLTGERRGIFNPQGARNAEEVVITESVIDAAALWSIGLRSVMPTYGTTGLTDEIVAHLVRCRVSRAVLMMDADEAGRQAAQEMKARLAQAHITARAVELPKKDAAEFIAAGGTVEDVRRIVAPPLTTPTNEPRPALQVETAPDGAILFTVQGREYRVRGLSPVGLDRLKVNVRLTAGSNFHLDTLDLYQARARALFAHTAAKLCSVPEQSVGADLLSMIERMEAARLEMRRKGADDEGAAMTPQERDAALSFLRDPRLCERITADFRRCGFVGERATVLTAYLAAVSRKLLKPLALLVVARSGAGKSALQDALCAFVPPEELVRVTRLTGQALFYKDPHSLRHKVLSIAEEEGATAAIYSLRTLASDQHLSIAATRTDPQTGKLHTEHYEVFGPVSIVTTTTSAEAFDEETRSRFVQLTMDESREQTRLILAEQRRRHTLAGVMERATAEQVRRLHHNAHRLLRALEVVNPYIEHLTYPTERLISRREQEKYLALINAIALLRQYQRETKRMAEDGTEVEYVEVTLDDIALAGELAREVLGRSLDDLSAPVRGMYRELQRICQERADALGCAVNEVQLSRREIREATGWSDWQVRAYCQQLVEMEYLYLTSGANGKRFVYELAWQGEDDADASTLDGLVDVEELKKRLKESGEE